MGTEMTSTELLQARSERRSVAGRAVRRVLAMGALVVVLLALAAPAALATYPDPPSNPQVNPQVDIRVAGSSTSQTSGGLAFTGGDIVGLVVVGGVLVGAGVVIIRSTRRRQPAVS